MAGAFLLMRVVLKPGGSPFLVLIFGIFSAFVAFPISFFCTLDPHVGEQKCSSTRCSWGRGREGTFLLIPACLVVVFSVTLHVVGIMEVEKEYCLLLC